MPGGWELAVIVFVVVLLFGAKKLPELAGSVGKSIKEFRKEAAAAAEDDTADTAGKADDES